VVKVINPLGSESASGRVGRSIIFQGSTAKVYRAPKIQKVAAQLDAEDRFQSVAKMILSCNRWGRAVFEAYFGRNWLSGFYQVVAQYWDDLVAEYALLGSGDQADWFASAPFKATRLDAGMTFFATARALQWHQTAGGLFRYDYPDIGDIAHDQAATWWARDLAGVLLAGQYDQEEELIDYWGSEGGWDTITDALAYGGSYRQANSGLAAWVRFWIYGTRISVIFKEVTVDAGLQISLNDGVPWLYSLNNIEQRYQQKITTPVKTKGLYRVYFFNQGQNGGVNVDGLIVHG
jgi:hypothetical protein